MLKNNMVIRGDGKNIELQEDELEGRNPTEVLQDQTALNSSVHFFTGSQLVCGWKGARNAQPRVRERGECDSV